MTLTRRDFLKISGIALLAPEKVFAQQNYSTKAKELYKQIWNLQGQEKDSKKPNITLYTASAEVERTIEIEDREYFVRAEGYVGSEYLKKHKTIPRIRKLSEIDGKYSGSVLDIQQRKKSENYEEYRASLVSVKDIGIDGRVDEALLTSFASTIRDPKDARWDNICKEPILKPYGEEITYKKAFNEFYNNSIDILINYLK